MRAVAGRRDGLDFEDFVAARGAALQHAAWLLTNDLHLAQDLVQTALTDAWRRWGRLSAPGHDVEAYVRRSLYTTYVSWWRRRSFSERPSGVARDNDDPGRRQASGTDTAHEAVNRVTITSALQQLSPQQRAVILLRFFDDRTIEATADILSMSTSAATTHQTRALARLRSSGLLAGEEIPR